MGDHSPSVTADIHEFQQRRAPCGACHPGGERPWRKPLLSCPGASGSSPGARRSLLWNGYLHTALLLDWLTVASSVQMAIVITAGWGAVCWPWGLTPLGCESWVRRENYLPLLLPVTRPDPWSEWAWPDSGLGSVLGLLSSDLASPGL